MSIRGMDAQIMVTRALDYVQEAATQLKGGERMQNMLAMQAQTDAEHVKSSVNGAEESQKAELHLENEAGGGSGYEPSPKKETPGEQIANEMLDADIGPSESIIDITL